MTTETINIIVRENGSRVVKRNFDLMARQAITTNSAVSILSRSLLGLTGGISVAIGLRTAISTLADFSQALSTVRAITGASTEQFKPLEAEIKKLGSTTRFTATQAAEGAQFLARAGFNAEQTTASLSGTLMLAQSANLDFGRAADIATNILTAFSIEVENTENVIDILSFAANRANTNVQQLGDAMKFVAPIASGMGVSLQTTTAAIMALSDAGLQGSIAGTGLRRVMTELEVANTGNQRILQRLGVQQDEVRPSVVGLANAIEGLRDAGLSAGEAMRFFGQRGGPAFENLARNIDKVRRFEDSLQDVGGFAREVARVMDDNLNGAILRIQAAFEALIIAVGDSGAFKVLTVAFDAVASTARFVANNITLFAVALQALIGIKVFNFLVGFIARNRELAAAIASGNAVMMSSVEIENARAASSLRSAQATQLSTAAKRWELQVGLAQLTQQRALLLQQQSSIVIDNQRRIARDALTGRFIAYNAAVAQNIRTNRALRLTEQAMAGTKAQLTAAITAQTAATNALSAAQTRQVAAAAATTTLTARLSRAFPVLAGVIGKTSAALIFLKALIVANPLGAIIVGVSAAVAAITHFSRFIKVTEDGLVSLRDVGVTAFTMIAEKVGPAATVISDIWTRMVDILEAQWESFSSLVTDLLLAIPRTLKVVLNIFTGLWVGTIRGSIAVIREIEQEYPNIFRRAMNAVIEVVEEAMNAVLSAILTPLHLIDTVRARIGAEPLFGDLDNIIDLSSFKSEVSDTARSMTSIFTEEMSTALQTDFIGNSWSRLIERARSTAEERIKSTISPLVLDDDEDSSALGGGGGGSKKTFADIAKDMMIQNELLRLNRREREALGQILKIENDLKRSLSATERELVLSLIHQNEVLEIAAREFDRVFEPADQYKLTIEALNKLLTEGRFSQDQFTDAMRRARTEFLSSQNDMFSGFERGYLKILEKTQDLASQTESIITRAFDGMSSSIADLVVTGKADFGSLIQSINKQIVQLVVSQGFQMLFGAKLADGMGGGGGANMFQGLRNLLGFQRGGSFVVGQNGASLAPLPGNDNRLVAFRAQDGEQVTVTPRGEQAESRNQNIHVTFNITTPDVQGFRNSQSQIAARTAQMISRAGRNQ